MEGVKMIVLGLNSNIVNVDKARALRIYRNLSTDTFEIVADFDDSAEYILGDFDNMDKAKEAMEYIVSCLATKDEVCDLTML
jgi:hypothetical protein